jgi:hypothetical protein
MMVVDEAERALKRTASGLKRLGGGIRQAEVVSGRVSKNVKSALLR